MKNLLTITLSLVLAFQLTAQQSAKKYAVKSGKIEYELTGNTTGTKTVFFDDYGDKYFEHLKSVSETKMFGVTDRTETDKITIINKSHFWTIDKINGENREGEVPYYNSSRSMFDDMTEEEQQKFSDELLRSFGGEREGTEKVLGYTCEKISVMGSRSWIYKGVTLKSETKVMGIVANETAINFEKDISISASKFNAPAGITFSNIQQQQQGMFGDIEMEMYEEEDGDEEDIVPVTYSFEKFKNKINAFHPEGYSLMLVRSEDGQHIALYTKGGFANIITVIATAEENMEFEGEMNEFETFTHQGKTLRYGDLDQDEEMTGKALLIPYKEHDMYIILMSAPGKDKNTLIKIADKLNF